MIHTVVEVFAWAVKTRRYSIQSSVASVAVTTILAQETQPRSLLASFVVLCCVRVISDKVQGTIECSGGHTNAALWCLVREALSAR